MWANIILTLNKFSDIPCILQVSCFYQSKYILDRIGLIYLPHHPPFRICLSASDFDPISGIRLELQLLIKIFPVWLSRGENKM